MNIISFNRKDLDQSGAYQYKDIHVFEILYIAKIKGSVFYPYSHKWAKTVNIHIYLYWYIYINMLHCYTFFVKYTNSNIQGEIRLFGVTLLIIKWYFTRWVRPEGTAFSTALYSLKVWGNYDQFIRQKMTRIIFLLNNVEREKYKNICS